ncbi:MAG: hypothetical protein ACLTQI_08260 [Slackia sp.]
MSIVRIEASKPYDVLIDECTLDEVGELARRVSGGDAARGERHQWRCI